MASGTTTTLRSFWKAAASEEVRGSAVASHPTAAFNHSRSAPRKPISATGAPVTSAASVAIVVELALCSVPAMA